MSAIALRIRSAAERGAMGSPLLASRFARSHHDASVGLLADAGARHVGIALERQMNGAPFKRLHRVECDRVARHLHLARSPHRYLAHGVLTPLAISLDVDDDPLALG